MRQLLVLLVCASVLFLLSCGNNTAERLDRLEQELEEARGELATLQERFKNYETLTDKLINENTELARDNAARIDKLERRLEGIAIGNNPPVASFQVQPPSAETGDQLSFRDTSTDDDSIVERVWDFGDGTSGSGETVTHMYANNGIYDVTLTVSDSYYTRAQTHTSVTIRNRVPTACFGISRERGNEGPYTSDDVFRFTDCSSDPDGRVVSWEWDFGDNQRSSSERPTHTHQDGGTYTVTLEIRDDDGAVSTASQTVTVRRGCEACLQAFNRVSEAYLRTCYQIEDLAEEIVDKRKRLGGFTSLSQISEIRYIGPVRWNSLLKCMKCTGCSEPDRSPS